MELKITNTLNHGNNVNLVDFYNENNKNTFEYIKQNNENILICIYNVHGWVNINKNITINENFNNIFELLVKTNADLIILQEVCTNNTIKESQILSKFKTYDYKFHKFIQNGGCFLKKNSTDHILILSRKELKNIEVIDVTNFTFNREICVFECNGIKFLTVHLEIGKRYHHIAESTYKINIIKYNTNLRIKQLDKILNMHNDIDIIIGDFNFTHEDYEFGWLLKRGFNYHGYFDNTTPYNRTDMLFMNKNCNEIEYIDSATINSNYSDHLPIIYEFKNIK
jgi:endonuclease/exonuclease/phosphatase family metal-dependent hydrolase